MNAVWKRLPQTETTTSKITRLLLLPVRPFLHLVATLLRHHLGSRRISAIGARELLLAVELVREGQRRPRALDRVVYDPSDVRRRGALPRAHDGPLGPNHRVDGRRDLERVRPLCFPLALRRRHALEVAAAIDSVIGPERALIRARKCAASAYVRQVVHDAVKRARPPLPFAHQLYREKKFPRANSRDPSRAKMMAKKSRYQVKKGSDRQKKKSNF